MDDKTIIRLLYDQFGGQPIFENYFDEIDPEQDNIYIVFRQFGKFLQALLIQESDSALTLRAINSINRIVQLNDRELDNCLKCELFALLSLSDEDLELLQQNLNKRAFKMLAQYQ